MTCVRGKFIVGNKSMPRHLHFARRLGKLAAARSPGDLIPGGLADKKPPRKFDPALVAEGAKVEREHTSNPAMAREIARDHISESRGYYTKLKKMEHGD